MDEVGAMIRKTSNSSFDVKNVVDEEMTVETYAQVERNAEEKSRGTKSRSVLINRLKEFQKSREK